MRSRRHQAALLNRLFNMCRAFDAQGKEQLALSAWRLYFRVITR